MNVWRVLADSAMAGRTVSTVPVEDSDTEAASAGPPAVRVRLPPSDAGATGLLKVTVIAVDSATFTALFAGVIAVTVGGCGAIVKSRGATLLNGSVAAPEPRSLRARSVATRVVGPLGAAAK